MATHIDKFILKKSYHVAISSSVYSTLGID